MPSDAKKKKAAAKKVAANARGGKKPAAAATNGTDTDVKEVNGVSNGVGNGLTNGHAKTNDHASPTDSDHDEEFMGSDNEEGEVSESVKLAREVEQMSLTNESVAAHRAVTGVLASHPESRDCHFINFSVTFHGAEILVDTKLELNRGRRYGLIGLNGCGKSTLLATLANRELPLPSHMDIFFLEREMPPSDKTALECVMEVDSERIELEAEAERLAVLSDSSEEAHDRLMDVYERLDWMDADKAECRASDLLNGLGFSTDMQNKKAKHFSGGWRMRIALARALFIKPSLLLLDEPTNHLDLEACVWLEAELSKYSNCLLIISHSQDFLNGVCTNILLMRNKSLKVFGGNYDSYMKTRLELEENQMKQYKWEQDQISHMKNYIARFGHGSAKLARQAQSKEKTLAKMVQSGLTEKVSRDKTLSFYFPDCGGLAPPVIMVQEVSFRYGEGKPWIYRGLDFGIDLDTRVALVGPNGAGKSTLLKLIAGELNPSEGLIRRHSHLRFGRYHQHLHEMLDVNQSSIEWMMHCFPAIKERDEMRKILGRYGLTGQQQVCPIRALSDGQRCRIIFAWLAQKAPHMLLLDEPTNHLDIETIDSLAEAIADYNGGLLLVSHDFRLISQVAEEIWVCEKETITKWKGDIFSYKATLSNKVHKKLK